jgi:hypothetical protein
VSEERPLAVWPLVAVPAAITLAVTLLRLLGELMNWSPLLFSREAGGAAALVGISWLPPVFGIYFAIRLERAGHGPGGAVRAAGMALAALGLLVATFLVLGVLLRASQATMIAVFVPLSWVAVWITWRGWPALGRTLLAYGLSARIPVILVMLVAMIGDWGTHYDVAPPEAPQVAQWGLLQKWFAIGVVPQLTVWIAQTVILGALFGSAALVLRRPRAVR